MMSLIGVTVIDHHFTIFVFLYATVGFGAKEFMSKKMNYFGYGLDDTFILGGILSLLTAVGLTLEQTNYPNHLIILLVMAIASSLAYLRYLNLPLALLACIGITGSLAILTLDYLIIGKSVLPFVLMLFSGFSYFITNKKLQNLTFPYYYNGLKLTKGFSLIVFYLAGNYFVVRETNAYLANEYSSNGISPEIPFALFFWAFTISVPALYLFFSLKKKDRMLLWIGFLTLCFSIFTIRIYHHILPPEVALTIGGILLFAFTYFSIRKLKYRETGITFKADRFTDANAFANLQVLATTSQFGLKPEIKTPESPIEFGGGNFSGGGSSGNY